MDRLRLVAACGSAFAVVLAASAQAPAPPGRAGECADIAPWGEVAAWEEAPAETAQRLRPARTPDGAWLPVEHPEGSGRWHLGVGFDEPRRFQSVRVVPADPAVLAAPPGVAVQFWRQHWPSGETGGWAPVDDDYHGRWEDIPGTPASDGAGLRLDFPPFEAKRPWPYRVARKVRVVLGKPFPIARIEVLSTARWREREAWLQVLPAGERGRAAYAGGQVEVHNGHLLGIEGVGLGRGDSLDPAAGGWSVERDGAKAVRLRLLATDAPDSSSERTIVRVRREDGFSFSASLLGQRLIWAEYAGVVIGVPPAEPGRALAPPTDAPKSFYRRVADEPEQTYERAAREIPALNRTTQGGIGVYLPLGAAHHRQEIAVRYTGDFLISASCYKAPGTDQKRLAASARGGEFQLRLPTGSPPDFRERRDGEGATRQSVLEDHLPVVTTRWTRDGIEFEQTAFATLLEGDPTDPQALRGDEPMVLCARIVARNPGTEPRRTTQWLTFQPRWAGLEVKDGWVRAAPEAGKAAVRMAWVGGGSEAGSPSPRWSPAALPGEPAGSALAAPLELAAGASTAFDVRWPICVPPTEAEAAAAAAIDFDAALGRVAAYWRGVVARGAGWEVPERHVQDFWRANLCHIYINADKDVDSGHVVYPAGTFAYNVCANEAVHQIRSLDLRGHHAEAARALEAFLALQGSRYMHGRFRTSEGVLHGLRVKPGVDYQTFNYNLDHGFVLWMLTEHYKLTGDRAWLEKNAAKFVAACDFVTRERKATMEDAAAGPSTGLGAGPSTGLHHGLLPEGHLEDPPEFLHWYAVNAYAYRGMRETAAILAEIGHAEAGRVRADAEAYGADLRRALNESRLRAPLEPLRDGRWIPFFPTRCHLLGRDTGWIRDALYGPVHLIDCGVFPARSREADWILEDAEDNVFVTESHGRKLRSEADWFSWGGITIQSNLLPNPLVYLARDEAKHAIRAFYNAFASHLYPDVRAFTEHPVEAYGKGAGPFYKTPDESGWVNWLRYLMIREDGDTLWLAQATPRGWLADGRRVAVEKSPTYFGPVSFAIVSSAAKGEIRARVEPPARRPCAIVLRLRHPEGKRFTGVTVDGKAWGEVDKDGETIRLGRLTGPVEVRAGY